MRVSRVLWVPSLLAVVLALGACGDDNSASDQACAARDDLSAAIQKVVDDVKAGNFGDARADLADVRTQAADLRTAVSDLAQKERDKLEPQTDQLKDDLDQLKSATSLDQLSTGLASAATTAQALVSQVESDLGC